MGHQTEARQRVVYEWKCVMKERKHRYTKNKHLLFLAVFWFLYGDDNNKKNKNKNKKTDL